MWIIILILFAIILLITANRYEHFMLFTANPVKLISSKCIDDSVRNVRLSTTGNIMYASINPPLEAKCNKIECPKYVNKYTTLGDNNVCWTC